MSTVDKIFIGVAVGAILGVLYAPDRGSATRRKLSRTGNDIRDRFNDFKDSISDRIDGFKEETEDNLAYEEMITEKDGAVTRPGSTWQSQGGTL